MQTFSLVLDDASLLWVVVCLYLFLSSTPALSPKYSSYLGEFPCKSSHLPQTRSWKRSALTITTLRHLFLLTTNHQLHNKPRSPNSACTPTNDARIRNRGQPGLKMP
ncbi:hypothetical protein K438DRAFT_473980 [Mycena galopus ATCC 62051]|nr:hypothetical protein K438DRAFT_473980 [Mycena galopus ATCC 62051]